MGSLQIDVHTLLSPASLSLVPYARVLDDVLRVTLPTRLDITLPRQRQRVGMQCLSVASSGFRTEFPSAQSVTRPECATGSTASPCEKVGKLTRDRRISSMHH